MFFLLLSYCRKADRGAIPTTIKIVHFWRDLLFGVAVVPVINASAVDRSIRLSNRD
jgi:hypothetical protein